MKKNLGIALLLLVIVAYMSYKVPGSFHSPMNLANLAKWTSIYSILGIGVAFVIITGGIDLSVGSMIGLVGSVLVWLLVDRKCSPWLAIPSILGLSMFLGLCHGLVITKLKVKPFIVTLCTLMIYRGFARWLLGGRSLGFGSAFDDGLRKIATGKIELIQGYYLPAPFFVMVGIAILSAIFLNWTIQGRYLLALGRNEQAARFSGIQTDRMTILAYVLCSLLAAVCGILFSLDINTIEPSGHGNTFELYAIAAAVLGGCSLRGGEGSILGVVIGSAIIRSIFNSINLLGVPSTLEFVVLGSVILVGTIVDEILRNVSARRRATLTANAG